MLVPSKDVLYCQATRLVARPLKKRVKDLGVRSQRVGFHSVDYPQPEKMKIEVLIGAR